jgi:NAD(P)-dependent dehydrogenase (short-subunit alcohol dehydrogenase family)
MDALIIGNGGVSKGFQELFNEHNINYDIYSRAKGDLYEIPQKIVKKYDLIIYAVGDVVWKLIKDITIEDVEKIFKANTFGLFLLVSVLPQILNEEGKIVIIGAKINRISFPNFSLYAASKSALRTFVEIAKREMRKYTFYLLEPEEIDTPIWNKIPLKPKNAKNPKEFAEEVLEEINLKY